MKHRNFRAIVNYGAERLPYIKEVPRHQHLGAYATLVLDGRFTQLSYAGRLQLQPGDILINPTLDCHSNQMATHGITLVRLPWREERSWGGIYRNVRIDYIRRLAIKDPIEASGFLEEQIISQAYVPPCSTDWPDKLVADLHRNPRLEIGEWAASVGLTRGYAWRCFQRSFGVGPTQFRGEMNARAAALRIADSDEPLCKTAADFGFSDQAHMNRAIKTFTGISPGRWRAAHSFKTGESAVTDIDGER